MVTQYPVIDIQEELVALRDEVDIEVDLSRHFIYQHDEPISLVRKTVRDRLIEAQSQLPTHLRLLVREGHRPEFVQIKLFDEYKEELQKKFPDYSEQALDEEVAKFVAPPEIAPHGTGGAVDLTLFDLTKDSEVDMGTLFNQDPTSCDYATFTHAQNIGKEASHNRELLIEVMTIAGFVNYPTEWWHWSYGDKYWAFTTKSDFAIYDRVSKSLCFS